jgi:glyoxylase-like metal-dependent hydrolase (beta-lactamase superfamily II)
MREKIPLLSRIAAILLLAATGAAAETVQPLTAQFVKTGLYVISGGGCNTVLRLSANGLILVDGKLPGNYEALMRRVKKISDQPVRALIVTDHHENHTGSNSSFMAEGTRIVAHENAKARLGQVAPPPVTYTREYTLRMGGVEARLLHFGNAHTDGDTVVYFPNLRVVAVGDLFASAPDPDYQAGGSLLDWSPVLAEILKLDFDVAVPGNGPPVSRNDLEAFKARIDTLTARAIKLAGAGVPREQLLAHMQTDDISLPFHLAGDQLARFYAEVSRGR